MIIKNIHTLFYLVVISLLTSSCGINSSLMLKTPKGGDFKYDSIPMKPLEDYKISKDDRFIFTVNTNNGQKIIERMSGVQTGNVAQQAQQQIEFIVRTDGFVQMPVIGDVKAVNLTIKEFQDTLAKLYSTEYQDPYVQVKITNQRIVVFPGNGGDAKVVPLVNNNTTLMEALALAGGISERGRAKNVKLMRNIDGKREVYPIDLSTIEGLKFTDMIVQANDYIYVEPHPRIGRELVQQITPLMAVLTTSLFIFSFLKN
jgi:polysaccharide export outer membrane protein